MENRDYGASANALQRSLRDAFWNPSELRYNQCAPKAAEDRYMYWWLAHAIDALLDGYHRTGDVALIRQAELTLAGVVAGNGGTLLNNWYDDMEWLALAMLRLWDVTQDEALLERIRFLWSDIKTAWNGHCGGGMAWKKDQPDYKNTPANAPAAILALRLHQRFGGDEDLAWGRRIFAWNRDNLMDLNTFYVYDGMNRLGDGQIDFDWDFSYCQGTMIGAALELWRITGRADELDLALCIARATMARVAAPNGGIMPYEGKDDCGLFRGIFFRYLADLAEATRVADLSAFIVANAGAIIDRGTSASGLVGGDWLNAPKPTDTVDLAQHLSGLMTVEMAWRLASAEWAR